MPHIPVVAIVGRPNTGKSTLFNRIVGEQRALVHDMPGMTRDRHYAQAEHRGRPFIVIDTGGYEDEAESGIYKQMREQTIRALEEADRIIFLCDVNQPNDRADDEIIRKLRSMGRPFCLAVNKCEGPDRENIAYAEFSRFGLDQIYPLSALHGGGTYELLDAATEGFKRNLDVEPMDPDTIRVAIVGRQNVGKSTLLNRLLGEERVIASDLAGTTRDSIDMPVTIGEQKFLLIDTAGIRRRGKIEAGAEKLSVHSSLRAIERCDVAIIVLDATAGAVTEQDAHIAGYVIERFKSAIIVINKWDALTKENATHGEWVKRVRESFKFMPWAPIITISAKTGQRASKLWGLIEHCFRQYNRKFPTRQINDVIAAATSFVSPPGRRGKNLTIKYGVQVRVRPPAIALYVNDPKLCHFSYDRYLENQIRMQLEIDATPLRIWLRRKAPPRGWDKDVRRKLAEEKGGTFDDLDTVYYGPAFDEDGADFVEPIEDFGAEVPLETDDGEDGSEE